MAVCQSFLAGGSGGKKSTWLLMGDGFDHAPKQDKKGNQHLWTEVQICSCQCL